MNEEHKTLECPNICHWGPLRSQRLHINGDKVQKYIFQSVTVTETMWNFFSLLCFVFSFGYWGLSGLSTGGGSVSITSTRSRGVGGFVKIHFIFSFWFSVLFQCVVPFGSCTLNSI